VSDQGVQFQSEYEDWCERRRVRPRYGAVGEHGSIAVIERFIRSTKDEALRRSLVPLRLADFQRAVTACALWYNGWRPHQSLGGATPEEVRDCRLPACRKPGIETRPRYPLARGHPTKMQKRCNGLLKLELSRLEGSEHLPIVALRRAA